MRSLIITALVFIAGTAMAEEWEPRSPHGWVLAYECRQIDPKEAGFTCEFGPNGMHLQWHEKAKDMPKNKKWESQYTYGRITLRLFELGGSHFTFAYDDWPSGKRHTCVRLKNKTYPDYTCS
jgi:hypothetical protein